MWRFPTYTQLQVDLHCCEGLGRIRYKDRSVREAINESDIAISSQSDGSEPRRVDCDTTARLLPENDHDRLMNFIIYCCHASVIGHRLETESSLFDEEISERCTWEHGIRNGLCR